MVDLVSNRFVKPKAEGANPFAPVVIRIPVVPSVRCGHADHPNNRPAKGPTRNPSTRRWRLRRMRRRYIGNGLPLDSVVDFGLNVLSAAPGPTPPCTRRSIESNCEIATGVERPSDGCFHCFPG